MDLNQQIERHFDLIYQSAMEDAQLGAPSYCEKFQFQGLETDEQLLIILKELERLDQEIEDFEHKEYFQFASQKANCYKIYSFRLLFYQLNEEAPLRKGFILSARRVHLTQLYVETELQLPPYSFSDFLNNKSNVVLNETGRKPLRTSREDYLKIRNYQTQKKLECISLQARKFKEGFIERVTGHFPLRELLAAEREQLENLCKNAPQLTPRQFITELLELKALTVDAMPGDENEFHAAFCRFLARENMRSCLMPQYFEASLQNIRAGKIANAPFCCWSLAQYDQWLADVLEEKIDLNDVSEPSYDLLFDQSYNEGDYEGQAINDDFQIKYPSAGLTKGEYKGIILEELDQLRTRFNRLKDLTYYHLILDKEALKNHFINQCLKKNEIDIQGVALKETVFLNNRMVFLQQELGKMVENPIEAAIDQMELDSQITEAIAAMVPKTALINELLKILQTTLQQSLQGQLPLLMIAWNLRDSLNRIYQQAEEHLVQVINKEPSSKKALFVSYQLREIQLKELAAKWEGHDLHEFFKRLKELLSIESGYLSHQPYHPIDLKELLQDPSADYLKSEPGIHKTVHKYKKVPVNVMAFTYDTSKGDNLWEVFQELKELGVFPKDLKLFQFRKFCNGTEIDTPLPWLGDQGDLMVFIKEAMKNRRFSCPHQQQWNITEKCFVKTDGSRFDPRKLKSSQPTALKSAFEQAAKRF